MCRRGVNVVYLVWAVAIHSVVHAITGITLIQSSYYVNYRKDINHMATYFNFILMVLGMLLICVLYCRVPLWSIVFAVAFMIVAVGLIIVDIIYYTTYSNFHANSILDAIFFHTDYDCWVGDDKTTTFWHVIAIILIIVTFLWFLYGALLIWTARCVCSLPCPTSATCMKQHYLPRRCCKKPKCGRKYVPPPCPPPCPPRCPMPCPPRCPEPVIPNCPQPCPPPCPPPGPAPCPPPCPPPCKKNPKFVLTLKPFLH